MNQISGRHDYCPTSGTPIATGIIVGTSTPGRGQNRSVYEGITRTISLRPVQADSTLTVNHETPATRRGSKELWKWKSATNFAARNTARLNSFSMRGVPKK